MLEYVFGFDKYADVTREFAIQGTYCDLAIKTGKQVDYLIEVKAIGLELKDNHLKQAVNYAAREGIKWVVLTNGLIWQIHRVALDTRVESEFLCSIDFSTINPKKADDAELLFLLCKRSLIKDNIDKFYEYKQSVNRYTIGVLLGTPQVANVVRKELRKIKPGIKVDSSEIEELIKNQVVKREIYESESGKEAEKSIDKYYRSEARAKSKSAKKSSEPDTEQTTES